MAFNFVMRSSLLASAIAVAANEGAPRALLALMLEKGFEPAKARRRE